MEERIGGVRLVQATEGHALLVGEIHSLAWQQAYKDLFPTEYIDTDNLEKRKKEFVDALQDERYQYFLVYDEDICVGIVKIFLENRNCEIASIYILQKYCGKGLGQAVVSQLTEMYKGYGIFLWTLEENHLARRFYEKNGFVKTGEVRTIFRGRDYVQVKYVFAG